MPKENPLGAFKYTKEYIKTSSSIQTILSPLELHQFMHNARGVYRR